MYLVHTYADFTLFFLSEVARGTPVTMGTLFCFIFSRGILPLQLLESVLRPRAGFLAMR